MRPALGSRSTRLTKRCGHFLRLPRNCTQGAGALQPHSRSSFLVHELQRLASITGCMATLCRRNDGRSIAHGKKQIHCNRL